MKLRELLEAGTVVVTDGAMGTYLQTLGYAGATPELANLTHPALVELAHRDYIAAGARVILTNTFGANRPRLAHHGTAGRLEEINRAAAGIACRVRSAHHDLLVAGDMGSLGELLDPYGSMDKDEAKKHFAEQAAALASAGVDFLLLETFADLTEARIAFDVVKERTGLPVVVSFSFNPGASFRTMMGQTMAQIAEWAGQAGVDALGANCGVGSAQMVEIVGQLSALTSIPLWAKPNAGLPVVTNGKVTYREAPMDFAANGAEAVRRGARFIGGCCGTSPAHIAALKKDLS